VLDLMVDEIVDKKMKEKYKEYNRLEYLAYWISVEVPLVGGRARTKDKITDSNRKMITAAERSLKKDTRKLAKEEGVNMKHIRGPTTMGGLNLHQGGLVKVVSDNISKQKSITDVITTVKNTVDNSLKAVTTQTVDAFGMGGGIFMIIGVIIALLVAWKLFGSMGKSVVMILIVVGVIAGVIGAVAFIIKDKADSGDA
jgi:hypothetical protein